MAFSIVVRAFGKKDNLAAARQSVPNGELGTQAAHEFNPRSGMRATRTRLLRR